jgi:hypothetical protein
MIYHRDLDHAECLRSARGKEPLTENRTKTPETLLSESIGAL